MASDRFRCRLLPYSTASGAWNMAADEVLLDATACDAASLRFYVWSEPTLSLGYFQTARVRNDDPRLLLLPYVRRPTGGLTLLHHHELTYALAVPARAPWLAAAIKPQAWLCRMHSFIARALGRLAITVETASCAVAAGTNKVWCFQHVTAGDLLVGEAKVGGSAQRKQRGGLLQHGAILLKRSSFAPMLPGLLESTGRTPDPRELQDAILNILRNEQGWQVIPGDWSAPEQRRIDELARTRYTHPSWNAKR